MSNNSNNNIKGTTSFTFVHPLQTGNSLFSSTSPHNKFKDAIPTFSFETTNKKEKGANDNVTLDILMEMASTINDLKVMVKELQKENKKINDKLTLLLEGKNKNDEQCSEIFNNDMDIYPYT